MFEKHAARAPMHEFKKTCSTSSTMCSLSSCANGWFRTRRILGKRGQEIYEAHSQPMPWSIQISQNASVGYVGYLERATTGREGSFCVGSQHMGYVRVVDMRLVPGLSLGPRAAALDSQVDFERSAV